MDFGFLDLGFQNLIIVYSRLMLDTGYCPWIATLAFGGDFQGLLWHFNLFFCHCSAGRVLIDRLLVIDSFYLEETIIMWCYAVPVSVTKKAGGLVIACLDTLRI